MQDSIAARTCSRRGTWLTRCPLAFILTFLTLSSAVAQEADEPEGPVTYEVFYQQTLRNRSTDSVVSATVYMPIPASDEYQEIHEFKVEVGKNRWRHEIKKDIWGNAYACVDVPAISAGQEVVVGYTCDVTFAPKRSQLDRVDIGDKDDIPTSIFTLHTCDDETYYDYQSRNVLRTATTFERTNPDLLDRLIAIHDYVVENHRFRSTSGSSASGASVFARSSGSAADLSNLFSALCRGAGIPTRLVGGTYLPRDKVDELPYKDVRTHRWTEVYLPGPGWVSVDVALNAANRRKTYLGTRHPRAFAISRRGNGDSEFTGASFTGGHSHGKELVARRSIMWSIGTRATFQQAETMYDEGKYNDARVVLQTLIEDSPGSVGAVLAQPLLDKISRNRRAQARHIDDKTMRQCRSWMSMATSFVDSGRPDLAISYLQRIVETCPKTELAERAETLLAELDG